jgi:hypothetical protein
MSDVDLHFLGAAVKQLLRDASAARDHRTYVEVKLTEIYESMATGAEITKLRETVTASLDQEAELDLRVTAIESRLGIKNPLGNGETGDGQ